MDDLRAVSIESEHLRLVPTSVDYVDDIFAEFTAEVTEYMFPKPAEVIGEYDKVNASGFLLNLVEYQIEVTVLRELLQR